MKTNAAPRRAHRPARSGGGGDEGGGDVGGAVLMGVLQLTEPAQEKCRFDGHLLQPCWALEKALEPDNSMRKGAWMIVTRNIKTMRPARSGVVLRSGEFAKGGVLINYCPFCGENIARAFEQEEAKTE